MDKRKNCDPRIEKNPKQCVCWKSFYMVSGVNFASKNHFPVSYTSVLDHLTLEKLRKNLHFAIYVSSFLNACILS